MPVGECVLLEEGCAYGQVELLFSGVCWQGRSGTCTGQRLAKVLPDSSTEPASLDEDWKKLTACCKQAANMMCVHERGASCEMESLCVVRGQPRRRLTHRVKSAHADWGAGSTCSHGAQQTKALTACCKQAAGEGHAGEVRAGLGERGQAPDGVPAARRVQVRVCYQGQQTACGRCNAHTRDLQHKMSITRPWMQCMALTSMTVSVPSRFGQPTLHPRSYSRQSYNMVHGSTYLEGRRTAHGACKVAMTDAVATMRQGDMCDLSKRRYFLRPLQLLLVSG